MRLITPDIALEKLSSACARAEICPADALKRLARWGISSSDACHIVDRLIDEGFISEERYALAYARDKMRFAGWGRRKITMGLKAKRLPPFAIAQAVDRLDSTEYKAKLVAVMRSKARSLKEELTPYERRQKVYAFALGRGYESSLISELLSSSQEEIWPSSSSDD
ncbi:MAG: RecX family transcriptional regulator [Pseudoflavonifractor sp.]|nr:RecX family transcriptional regulator [Pseudoflavonifractor sp.]